MIYLVGHSDLSEANKPTLKDVALDDVIDGLRSDSDHWARATMSVAVTETSPVWVAYRAQQLQAAAAVVGPSENNGSQELPTAAFEPEKFADTVQHDAVKRARVCHSAHSTSAAFTAFHESI